ncbi:expressed protein [Chlorella variabilis]|uniref:Expressed protein n=1 Tax=Chlorella variabilis TaxID=554065 RepID=E1Z6A9_CHLVA|nr:expressed protein [Chlorella variabilis]EFN58898.1 expressed protein [Chlorella variabilis]|eukprot:XP_005851000.1 expressed protein [Chlorella variabilis]
MQALTSDPNFLRISKGAYSLHCFHPEKEQLVKAPQPKEPKKVVAADTPVAAGEGGEPKEEKEVVPMVAVQAKTLEEVEKQYKEGTVKHVIVEVLKAVQPEALTAQAIVDKAKELGLREFEEKQKAAVGQALTSDPNFLRISKGAYSLHCFHPDKEQLVKAKKRKMSDHFADADEPGSKRQEGSAAPQAGEEAEQHVKQTKRSLALHRAALEKAQAEYDAAKAAYEQDKKRVKTPAKERISDVHIPAEQLAQFEVTEEERQYKGESDDLKAKLEHRHVAPCPPAAAAGVATGLRRQKLQARAKELEKAKKAFLEAERHKRDKAAKESNKEMRTVEGAFRKAERVLEHERRAAESAEKAAAAAEKRLEKEKEKAVRGEEKAKEREEREKQKLVEREEREKRKAEAARAKEEARKYPMEDLELLEELRQKAAEAGEAAPDEDVAQPSWMSAEDSQRLSTALYVADFVSQFSKQLGCRGLNYEHLEQVLADATSGGGSEDDCNASVLHSVYESLIRVILDDLREEDVATAQEKRWDSLLRQAEPREGTWPEVLRRFVLTRVADEEHHKRPDRPAIMSASMLAYDAVDRLTHDQHLALLRFLCDTVLDSEKMRRVLQRREDEAVDAKRDVRGELAEQRKQLKELLDAEKEERKRKREDERRAAEEVAAAAAEASAAAAEGTECGAAAVQQDGQKPASKQGSVAPMDVDGPSFELPERLREFTGADNDKKALLQWRQEQQTEKRRLDKERNKWMAEQLRRQREVEAAEKAAREAEKAKQREKEEKEEAIFRAQEALEEKLEKYSTRRAPLGADRHHRRYWWGLAGHRPAVYVEDGEGRWGSVSSLAELDALVGSLDRRGIREMALAEAIEKRFQTISVAMLRAERIAAAAAGSRGGKQEKERAEPPRRSGRQTQQVEFFDPAKGGSKGGEAPSATGLAALFGPAECAAVEAAAGEMAEVQKSGASLLAAPEGCGSWKEWAAGVQAAAAGELEQGGEATAAAVRSLLQARLVQLEAALLAESVGGLAADGDSSDEEASEGAGERQASGEWSPEGSSPTQPAGGVLDVVDDLFSPSKRPEVSYLWKTQRERSTWQADVRQASTAARLAYCAAVLAQQAAPMLATLRKARASGAKKGGKGSGKASGGAKAAAAESRAASKAAAAASSRPVSRTSSMAALEAAPGKKEKGKRKAAAPPPENMRLTRSRH